jgi:hypothetical protein
MHAGFVRRIRRIILFAPDSGPQKISNDDTLILHFKFSRFSGARKLAMTRFGLVLENFSGAISAKLATCGRLFRGVLSIH